MSELVLEKRSQADKTVRVGIVALTPSVGEDYWSYRVMVGETQAIVAFPKFSTIGIGFAQEDDWNSNLPYTLPAERIFDHIKHNKGNDSIADDDCLRAIRMIQDAINESPAGDPR